MREYKSQLKLFLDVVKRVLAQNNWHSDLLIGQEGIEISFVKSNQIIEWCWENKLPVISGKVKRSWMYKKNKLPSKDGYEQVSKEKYYSQMKSACNGY